ncbi:3-isopropylmalate dehydrogenase [Diplodia corticola]|uniref:3-isopropylmalate dehydrogenase n=1 Tax=Diplodia corticola TaxID=236234 RepID=A0A1J9RW37_9PEZI|nr:3-isopropylmalate dehydrogenase [Diplodia corticola]OJD36835.1 3-isopropylmalate dehydrogenase [Diplodia corticola]
MAEKHTIVVFGGDYSGPEVMAEGLKVLAEVQRQHPEVTLELKHHLIGGAAWDAHGVNITDEAISDARSASAVLLGAVGGPKWAQVPVPVEWGLGDLRKALDAFGNLRPVNFAAPSLISRSAFKPAVCAGTDMTIVRELTGGIYFGARQEPSGGTLAAASDTDAYTHGEIARVARLAGALAMAHDPPLPVTSLDKANVLAACGRLWRRVVTEVMADEFPQVELRHLLIDSAAMVMACDPTRLNGVVLTSNMFGDIISDEASAIPGSIGLLPSASLCAIPDGVDGSSVRGLYEPIHGSAPDISGKQIVNPVGMILSVAMMFRWSLNMATVAKAIEDAVRETLDASICTPDVGGTASTSEVGNAVVTALAKNW